ncbi:THAP domain-containing protein 5-like [Dreissena polymorpha]|uniref:THAP domain-containing protein 5-like n=1 Tax=Dreissena polymorpha TaxID=45954 RepID=UPI0022642CD0|nr:THAP domain-containing protein 5-like [Dreissena polymorpha]
MPQTMCCVPFCSRKGRHKFPKDKQRQAAWVQAIRRVKTKFEIWTPSEYSYVCENHFTEDDYHTITYAGNERRKRALRKTAVPSIFSWTNKATVAKSQERKERRLERENRKRKLFEDVTNMEQSGENTSFEPEYIATKIDIVTTDIDVGASEEVVTQQECVEQIISITDEKVTFMDSFVQTECETEDAAIQTTTTLAFSINKFEDDEAAVHFYTGLENYMKFFFVLVGSTPGGLISYVSPAYGGATSDRQIVERSSLTRLCSKSDSIMADKGFNVQDIFAPHDVHINIPTLFKKQNRISNETAIKDRKISRMA